MSDLRATDPMYHVMTALYGPDKRAWKRADMELVERFKNHIDAMPWEDKQNYWIRRVGREKTIILKEQRMRKILGEVKP